MKLHRNTVYAPANREYSNVIPISDGWCIAKHELERGNFYQRSPCYEIIHRFGGIQQSYGYHLGYSKSSFNSRYYPGQLVECEHCRTLIPYEILGLFDLLLWER